MSILTHLRNAYKASSLNHRITTSVNSNALITNGWQQFCFYGSKSSGNSKFFRNRKSGKNSKRRALERYKYGTMSRRKSNITSASITPVALISSEFQRLTVALIPINLFEGNHDDSRAFQEALAILALLRDNSRQVKQFMEGCKSVKDAVSSFEKPQKRRRNVDLTEFEGFDEAAYLKAGKKIAPSPVPMISFTKGKSKEGKEFGLPETIENDLRGIPLSGMELNFEMDMTNVRDALLNPGSIAKLPPKSRKKLQDLTLTLSTNVHMDPKGTKTIPLHFNALIHGTVDINPKEFSKNKLESLRVPEFNEYVTAIAANVCSTALQKGFPTNICRKFYSTGNPADTGKQTTFGSSSEASVEDVTKLMQRFDKGNRELGSNEFPAIEKNAGKINETLNEILERYDKFRNELEARDVLVAQTQTRDPSEDEVVNRLLKKFGQVTREASNASETSKPHENLRELAAVGYSATDKKAGSPIEGSIASDPTTLNLLSSKELNNPSNEASLQRKTISTLSRDDSHNRGSNVASEPSNEASLQRKTISTLSRDDSCNKGSNVASEPSNETTLQRKTISTLSRDDSCNKSSNVTSEPSNETSLQRKTISTLSRDDSCNKGSNVASEDSCKKIVKKAFSSSTCETKGPCKKPSTPKASKSRSGSKSGSKDSSAQKSKKAAKDPCKKLSPEAKSKCGPKRSASKDPCKKSRSGSKDCGAKKTESKSKCGPKKSASKDPCKRSRSGSKDCGAKKSESKSKCGPKKSASKDPCKKSRSASKDCGSKKTESKSKCGASASKDPCKKSRSSSKDCGAKKTESKSKCFASASKDPCKKSRSDSKDCGAKKTEPKSKCGASASKDPCKKSRSGSKDCGAKKAESKLKCGASDSKDPCKKSRSSSKDCGAKKTESKSKCFASASKDPCKKSRSDSKDCGAKKTEPKSKCGASASKDPCKKSRSVSKDCGAKKNESISKCGASASKDPCKKSRSASKDCGAKNKSKDPCKKSSSASKCASKASDLKSKCAPSKSKTSSCKGSSSSASKCGSKTSVSKSKCAPSTSNLGPKCGSKSSASKSSCKSAQKDPCKSKSDSKKSDPCKRSSSASKCDSKSGASKDPCKKSASKGGPSKAASKCGSKALVCGPEKKPKCTPEKPADTLKACKRAATAKCGSGQKNEPSSERKDPCKKSDSEQKFKCGRPPTGSIKPKCPKKGNQKGGCGAKKFHSLSSMNLSIGSVPSRFFSDKCRDKNRDRNAPPKNKKAVADRRETCRKFSWKEASKSTEKRNAKTRNCYPEETEEFCPDTPCYRVQQKGKKENRFSGDRALYTVKRPLLQTPCLSAGQHYPISSSISSNREAVIEAPYQVSTRTDSFDELLDNEVLVKIDAVALSDSDLHTFETGGRKYPGITLGNEAAGIIEEVGCNVTSLKPGDHVAIESGIPCGVCDLCKIGHYNLCGEMSFKRCLSKYCTHPAAFCHKISKEVPLEHAALAYQMASGCYACQQAGIKPDSNVVIIGSCTMTVCAAICAKLMGAGNVCVMCSLQDTLHIVREFVTDKVDCFTSRNNEKGIVRMILAQLGTHPDIIINCASCTKSMNATVMALKPAGICVVSGFLSDCASFNMLDALMKEIYIRPSFRSRNMFPLAIKLLESGRAPIDCVLAHCCGWNEMEGAFQSALSEANNGPRKVVVQCQLDT